MKTQSLYWRQFLLTAGMIILTMVVLAVAFMGLSYNYVTTEKRAGMEKDVELVTQLATQYYTGESLADSTSFRTLASFAAEIADVQLLVCDNDGSVIMASDSDIQGRSLSIPEATAAEIRGGEKYSGVNNLGGIYEHKQYIVGESVMSPYTGNLVGMILVTSDMSSFTQMWRAFFGIFFFTMITVMLIAVVLCSVTTVRQTKPIQDMVRAVRSFAAGNLDVRVNPNGQSDEMGELADAFNLMADSLQQTELRRREFIANVSHELKTPMTSIAGYTDGILDGTIPREKEKKYLQIISDESRRMSRLVRRMLDISRLQATDVIQEKRRFDVCESMRRTIISMEMKITDRGLDVEADIPEDSVFVMGDPDLIQQVIYNLMENAAKFAERGSTLKMGIGIKNGKALVFIQNRGETISPEEIPLLFERFHKSDKSRSEDKDGVGLGLYIVKTILRQHREDIKVTSENGLTTFAFTLTLAI
ncbi:MAG: HAMP domain-containing sensor histidine kinase [Oscillospiraceae bacterium]|nr:HAMP domain-containing sensor histidine kinase [Oscillospiraceae bacterium]